MNAAAILAATFDTNIESVVPVSMIDESIESPEMLALSAARHLLEDADDEPTHIAESPDGWIIKGNDAAVLIGPNDVVLKPLADEDDDDEDDDDLDYDDEPLDEAGMSKKHFVKFAKMIKAEKDRNVAKRCAQMVASVAKDDSPRFDASRFYTAAGITESLDESEEDDDDDVSALAAFSLLNAFVSENMDPAVLTTSGLEHVRAYDAATGEDDYDAAYEAVAGLVDLHPDIDVDAIEEFRKMSAGRRAKVARAKKKPKSAKQKMALRLRRKKRARDPQARRKAAKYRKKEKRHLGSSEEGFEVVDVEVDADAADDFSEDMEAVFGIEFEPEIEEGVVTFVVPTEIMDAFEEWIECPDDVSALAFLDEMVGNPAKGKEGKLRLSRFTGSDAIKGTTAVEEAEIADDDELFATILVMMDEEDWIDLDSIDPDDDEQMEGIVKRIKKFVKRRQRVGKAKRLAKKKGYGTKQIGAREHRKIAKKAQSRFKGRVRKAGQRRLAASEEGDPRPFDEGAKDIKIPVPGGRLEPVSTIRKTLKGMERDLRMAKGSSAAALKKAVAGLRGALKGAVKRGLIKDEDTDEGGQPPQRIRGKAVGQYQPGHSDKNKKGAKKRKKRGAALESLDEGATPGLLHALAKGRVRRTCGGCQFSMPTYPGRYPSHCPNCDAEHGGDPHEEEPTDEKDMAERRKKWTSKIGSAVESEVEAVEMVVPKASLAGFMQAVNEADADDDAPVCGLGEALVFAMPRDDAIAIRALKPEHVTIHGL